MEGRLRQREQTEGKGSRLTEGRLRRREPDDGGNDQVGVAD